MDPNFEMGMALRGKAPYQVEAGIANRRTDLATAQFMDEQQQRHKKEADAGKAAEYFFKANPDALGTLGESPESFANRSAGDKYAAMLAYGQQQLQALNQAKMEDERAQANQRLTADRDAGVFQKVLQSYGQAAPASAPALDAETDQPGTYAGASPAKPDYKDFLMKFYQGGGSPRGGEWASQAFKNLTGASGEDAAAPEQTMVGDVPYVWKRGSKEFQPRADYGLGVRQQNALDLITAKEAARPTVEAGAAPITSPDGKFYWSGNRWVAVREEDPVKAQIAGMLNRGNTNAPARAGSAPAPAPAASAARTPAQQAVLDDFKAGKLSRDAARVRLQQLGLQ